MQDRGHHGIITYKHTSQSSLQKTPLNNVLVRGLHVED